ncbi:MAG TPA: type II toxin-antitoxin system Phd/YefM family antitoxin [Planctomycetota bacterium]|nr:type II toxin-antitoxin system Phd/YefM family antitoxin [Planctomycetota bacterium]
MKFITVRDLRSRTAAIRKELATERDMVVTANGRPFALLSSVHPDRVEEDLLAIRSARALRAMDRIQAWSKARGLDKMTMEEIDALIAKVRRERGARVARRA